MAKFQIFSKAGVDFGVYEGETAEEAFAAMIEDGGSSNGAEGTAANWDITEVSDGFGDWTGLDSELRGTDMDPQNLANARGLVIVRDDDAATVGAECWYGIAAADVAAALADYRNSGGTVSQQWVPQSV